MPELPEVETLATGLRQHIQGKTIKTVIVLEPKKFKGTLKQLKQSVFSKKVTDIERHGKWLVLKISSGYGFVIHLKMTGQLLYDDIFLGGHTMTYEKINKLPNNHTRVIFEFTDKSRLYFQDMRKFGYVELYSAEELKNYFVKKKLGVDPLTKYFTFKYFAEKLKHKPNTTIKAVLLDQTVIAGIGNIYADDSCFVAKIKPMRRVKTLTKPEQQALYKAIKQILKQAIKLGGTSFSDYYQIDGKLGQYWKKRQVYGRTGEPCSRCGTPIKKTRCAGRGTHYCTKCQV
ncbi:MAG: bifunctional DNA-formamidopyrimidine glycosylase/DNA-(apurinic or apyrimidinic site) lyase [Patescibacteria group bacterium]|jgi:formamidopyrimidine-DNA glycosylase